MTSMKEKNETFRRLSAEDEDMYQNPRCTFKGAQLSQPPISVDFEKFVNISQKEQKDASAEVLKSIKLPRPFAV